MSLYYDEKLKKWVNPATGPTAAAAPVPPPPKGPSSRASSGPGPSAPPMGSGPPPRAPSGPDPTSVSQPLATVPPLPSSNPGTPPANTLLRPSAQTPASAMSHPLPPSNNASRSASPALTFLPQADIPQSNEPVAQKLAPPLAPPSRPSTAVSNASDIDSLLGEPAVRKGGTMKKGRKSRNVIDVFGKKLEGGE